MAERVEADVCIVGAGYAGLTAAWELTKAGKTVVVLEARDRVGGRIWSIDLPGGGTIDRGGAFLANRHEVMHGLASEFGVATYKTNTSGAHLLVGGGKIRKYKGLIPKISPLAVASIARAQIRLDRMAKTIPVDAPWTAKRATEWDAQTIGSWFEKSGVHTDVARHLFSMSLRGCFTQDLSEVSFLHCLFLIRSAKNFNTLMSIEGGYQENLVDGGAGAMAARMADKLGDAVRLSTPVRGITQTPDHVTIDAGDVGVEARHVICSVPPALALEIAFDPALPDDRRELYTKATAGHETKTMIVYDEPFWRPEFSGQTAGPGSAAEVTLDATPMSGTPGVIASFTFGPNAQRVDALDPAERRRLMLDELVQRLGPQAANPRDFVETKWWDEEWTRGCTMAHYAPGVLTTYGHLLTKPFGRVHWAGTETATVSHGAMDGAARSGLRAAAETLDRA
jgi:monoamine oxidase